MPQEDDQEDCDPLIAAAYAQAQLDAKGQKIMREHVIAVHTRWLESDADDNRRICVACVHIGGEAFTILSDLDDGAADDEKAVKTVAQRFVKALAAMTSADQVIGPGFAQRTH